MNYQCREYRSNDFSELLKLMATLGYPLTVEELKKNIHLYQEEGGQILVAEKNGVVLGCITVTMSASVAEGVYGEIKSLVVSEKARGMGVGSVLSEGAEAWLSERVNRIRVRTNSVREKAHKFYEKQGYSHVKSQKVYSKDI